MQLVVAGDLNYSCHLHPCHVSGWVTFGVWMAASVGSTNRSLLILAGMAENTVCPLNIWKCWSIRHMANKEKLRSNFFECLVPFVSPSEAHAKRIGHGSGRTVLKSLWWYCVMWPWGSPFTSLGLIPSTVNRYNNISLQGLFEGLSEKKGEHSFFPVNEEKLNITPDS